jgi:hypothetical protein
MATLVLALCDICFRAQLTLAAEEPVCDEELLAAGVETVVVDDWGRLFSERRFHYDAVVVSDASPLTGLVAATQPQAVRVRPAIRPAGLARELAEAGIATGATAVRASAA